MKYCITIIVGLIAIHAWGQEFNAYKYIVVDNQYEFQNESNEYLLNDLAVFELNKRGFTAFKNDKVQPNDKNLGSCNTLQMKVDAGGTLDRRLTLSFEDCDGNVLFTTQEGIGREKDDKRAYYKAMREAMKSLDDINYQYEPQEIISTANSVNNTTLGQPKATAIPVNAKLEKPQTTSSLTTTTTIQRETMTRSVAPMVYEYSAPNTPYRLERKGENFIIWSQGQIIGNLKKSGGGCYLAVASDFVGIGYFKEGLMVIDANQKGEEVQLSFIKN